MADDTIEQVRVRVEFEDGRTFTTTIQNPDMLRFEDNTDRLHLGSAKQSPVRWLNYCTWASLSRTHMIDGMPWEAFKAAALVVQPLGNPVAADPTRPDPEAG